MGASGGSIGSNIGERMRTLVSNDGRASGASTRPTRSRSAARSTSRRGAVQHEARWGSSAPGARVSRDDLRLSPLMPPIAWWKDDAAIAGTNGGIEWSATGEACVLCIGAGERHDVNVGATSSSKDGHAPGVDVELNGNVHAALAAAEVNVSARHELGPATVTAHGRASGLVGGELDGHATAELGPQSQRVAARGGAMAGAVAHAEGGVGVDLLGVAITQSGSAEAWAGAGGRGTFDVGHSDGKVSWKFGAGSALGLGAAGEWSGSIDASAIPARHRNLARDALIAGVSASQPGLGALLSLGTR